MSKWLDSKGFKTSEADPCLFINKGTILFLWVDDIIIIGPKKEELIKEIQKDFKIKDLGKAQHVLGMKISNKEDGSIRVDQEHYIKALIKKYNMEDAKIFGTPLQSNIKLEKATTEESEEFKKSGHDYRAAVGSLNYLSQCTRPDITYTVGILSQHLENPGEQHWGAFKRCLRYLKGSQNLGLEYTKTDDFNLVGYTDSSWAEDNLKQSTSGFVYYLGKNLISWRSKKISAVSLSSTEAEYRAYLSAAQEAKWLRKMLEDTFKPQSYALLYSDNQGAIKLASNPVFHSRTKHIDVHYNYIREAVKYKEIALEYIPTADMNADIMTKALDRNKHVKFSIDLRLLPPTGLRGGVEDVIPVEGNISSLVSITHDYKSKDVNHEKELEELIPVIPYTAYNDNYKCMKDKEINHVEEHDNKEETQESILMLNRKLIDNMHLRMHHKLFKEREIKLKYLEMFHFQSKKIYSLKKNKLQLKMKKGNKYKGEKGNEPFRLIAKGSPSPPKRKWHHNFLLQRKRQKHYPYTLMDMCPMFLSI